VLGGADKIILDSNAGNSGVVPYLPLGEIGKPAVAPPRAPQAGARP
jgi:hypothetical protein